MITSILPLELVEKSLLMLTLHEISAVSLCNKLFAAYIYHNARIWKRQCALVWKGKYLSAMIQRMPRTRETLRFSIEESKRTVLDEDELAQILWRVQFQSTSGSFWLVRTRGKVLYRKFLPGGIYWHPVDDPLFGDRSVEMPDFTWMTFMEDGVQMIQLSGMPPHQLSRDCVTWKWILQGIYTWYDSVQT